MYIICYFQIIRDEKFNHGTLNAISITKQNFTLFIGTQNGVILSIVIPMMYEIAYKEFKMHKHSIIKVLMIIITINIMGKD